MATARARGGGEEGRQDMRPSYDRLERLRILRLSGRHLYLWTCAHQRRARYEIPCTLYLTSEREGIWRREIFYLAYHHLGVHVPRGYIYASMAFSGGCQFCFRAVSAQTSL